MIRPECMEYLAAGFLAGAALGGLLATVLTKKQHREKEGNMPDRAAAPGEEERDNSGQERTILDSIDREPDPAQAVRILEKAVKDIPRSLILKVRLAEMYAGRGDAAAAEETLGSIQDPERQSIYYRAYGDLSLQRGDLKKAKEYLTEAMRLAEDGYSRAHVYFSMARLYRETEEREKAKENVQKAIALTPRQYFIDFLSQLEREEVGRRYLRHNEIREDAHCSAKPLSLMIVPTQACNIRCKMCRKIEQKGTLPYSAFEKIWPLIPSLEMIYWQGGEIFLWEYFDPFFKRICKEFPRIRHTLFTNGLLFNDERIRMLSAANMDLTLSIDSLEKRTYENIRKGGDFDTLLANVDLVSRAFQASRKGTLSVNTIVMKSNMHGLGLFPEFCKENGIAKLNFGFMYDGFPEENVFDEKYPGDIAQLSRIVEDVERQCAERGIVFGCNFRHLLHAVPLSEPDTDANKSTDTNTEKPRTGFKCLRPWNTIFIDSDGSVMPWCACEIPVGNILEKGIDEIWNGDLMKTYRQKLSDGNAQGWCREECIRGIET